MGERAEPWWLVTVCLLPLEAAVVAVRRSVVHGQVQVVVVVVERRLVGARSVVVVVVVHVAVGDAPLEEVVVVQGEQVLQGRDVGGRRQWWGHHHLRDGRWRRVWWGRVGGGSSGGGLIDGTRQHESPRLHGRRKVEQHGGVVDLELRQGGREGAHTGPLGVGLLLRIRGGSHPLP